MAHAQSADNKADTSLSTVVVTASGTAVDIKEAPASISVITREDIERKPVTSIGELLSTIPGVTGGLSGTGAQSKIKLRGLPEKYTLILVDGKRQGNSAGINYRDDLGSQDLDWISPEMIERIEVVRGPMSSLYGSDAMGGVINIITRKIGKRWSGSTTLNYSKPSDGDRGDTRQLGFNISGPLSDKFGLRLGGNYTDRAADESTGGFPGTYQSTAGSRKQNLNALLNWQLTPDQVIGIEAAQGIQRATGSDARTASGDQVVYPWGLSKLEQTKFGLSHDGRWGDLTSKLNLVHNKYEDKGDTIGNNSKETTLDGRIDKPLKLWGLDQAMTLGMQWRRESLDNRDTIGLAPIDYAGRPVSGSGLSATTWALFGEDQIFLRDNLALTLGLRMDHHQKYGNNWSPRAYLVYHPASEWTVRGGVSRGFRAPNLKENSASAATQSGGNGCRSLAGMGWTSTSVNADGTRGCYMAGNPDLQPETSTNFELGTSWDRNGWALGATYFHTNFKNKIDYQPLGFYNGFWWTRMANAQRARTRGLEGFVNVPLAKGLTWNTNITKMFESKNLSTGASLLAVPELSIYSSLQWQIRQGWSAMFSARHVGKEVVTTGTATTFAKAYTTFDVSMNYNVTDTLTLRAGIINLADKETRTIGANYDNGGRTYFVGMTARF
ncbi:MULTISPECIES: TonB-dependent receptor domain-containing protein [Delftia]|jgi:outer membrane receptor for ferrienterochelin and colicins|uniref:TonB-dependent receptor domain-containing protein n=1 Tax=Delftia TaxID=80865 RepID=UPI00190220E8|nr:MULTISPECIES: TonB-dependent receptor [Delftia]MBK0114653.1 TonB-dependent receptor [Delftia sp. S65]MBK0120526.1 TonB-dependent receptor [Delftia sp. S67]MBK0132271.1 TonB-dependent receptor [Delftia sp. S66]MCA1070426.1 Colicin I receptor [Delftia acidovorans]